MNLPIRLLNLLHKWVAYELSRMCSRGIRIPPDTYMWGMDKLCRFHLIAVGLCWERSTAPGNNSRLEEFGCAFRKLEEVHQQLILADEFGSPEQWREIVTQWGLSQRYANAKLNRGKRELKSQCRRRGLI